MMGQSSNPVLRRAACWLLAAIMLVPGLGAGIAAAQDVGADGIYRLRPGDVIIVNVLEDPELDAQVLVLPDGRISLPVAGTVMAAGRSPAQVERTVRARLSRNFVQPPNVTVTVSALAPEDPDEADDRLTVTVLGQVGRPGRFDYDPEKPITVLEALSLAGGVGPFAARARIQVRELVEGTETLRLFDYAAFEDGLINSTRDLTVLGDGAVVVVPERGLFE